MGNLQGVGRVIVAVKAVVHVVVITSSEEVKLGELAGKGLEHFNVDVGLVSAKTSKATHHSQILQNMHLHQTHTNNPIIEPISLLSNSAFTKN